MDIKTISASNMLIFEPKGNRHSFYNAWLVCFPLQLEDKQKVEFETFTGKLSKDYDTLMTSFYAELVKLQRQQQQHKEKCVCQQPACCLNAA